MTFPTELKNQFAKLLNKNKISYTSGWANYMGNVNNPAAMLVEVNSEQEIQTVLKAIKEMNSNRSPEDKITVRATAGRLDKVGTSCGCFPWGSVLENKYNEGFSFSPVVGGRASENTPGTDIIIRFGQKFNDKKVIGPIKNPIIFNPDNPIHKLPSYAVEVSAGVQISELSDFLRKNNLSLTTVSMIPWVTAVGLSGTAGHGTGRDEPAFSGLIESIKVCDMDGNIRKITRDHPDFALLAGGHSGLLGIILSMKLRVVEAFNLCETVELFPNTNAMSGKLGDILKKNQYISIMGMPSHTTQDADKLVPKWQIRKWNYSKDKPTKIEKATYAPDIASFNQEVELKVGNPVMEFLLDSGLQHLLPYYMLLTAAVVTATRGTKPITDYENNITHPQVAFPKLMRDVSYLIPVKDDDAGKTLETILQKMEGLIADATKKGEYPVTYAIYVRYIKGTNGGLSTSCTNSDDEHVLAIDVVTHLNAPGVVPFEQNLLAFFKEMGITPRNHLGKNFPVGVNSYEQFLGSKAIDDYKGALERWYCSENLDNGAERLTMSPFYTPYLQSMLSPAQALTEKLVIEGTNNITKEIPHHVHSESACTDFVTQLHAATSMILAPNAEVQAAKTALLNACRVELENRNSMLKSAFVV